MSCQDPQGYDCAKALERMAFFNSHMRFESLTRM